MVPPGRSSWSRAQPDLVEVGNGVVVRPAGSKGPARRSQVQPASTPATGLAILRHLAQGRVYVKGVSRCSRGPRPGRTTPGQPYGPGADNKAIHRAHDEDPPCRRLEGEAGQPGESEHVATSARAARTSCLRRTLLLDPNAPTPRRPRCTVPSGTSRTVDDQDERAYASSTAPTSRTVRSWSPRRRPTERRGGRHGPRGGAACAPSRSPTAPPRRPP